MLQRMSTLYGYVSLLYFSPKTQHVWLEQASLASLARMSDIRNACKILVGYPEDLRPDLDADGKQGSSVSIVSVYGLDDWRPATEVRFLAGEEDFSSSLCVQTGSRAHPASCTMSTGGHFPGHKARRRVTLATHSHLVPRSRLSRSYTSYTETWCNHMCGWSKIRWSFAKRMLLYPSHICWLHIPCNANYVIACI
jgi:hypothetical protein